MFDINSIIESGGLLLIGLIIFAESGLLIGFFLPGDTLLFSAGFFASQDKLPLLPLLLIVVVAAIVGDNVGYRIGKKTGKHIFRKKDGLIFRREYLLKAESFYSRHGGKTIVLARFVPIIRTFAPVVAGAAQMSQKKFASFNVIGGLFWGVSVTIGGFLLGSRFSNIDKYIFPVVILASAVTFAPALYRLAINYYKAKKN